MIVTELAAADADEWDRYVLGHPAATGCHLSCWRRIIEEVFGHAAYYLIARDSHANVRGVLPLILVSSRVFGRFLVSMPFLNSGGVLSDSSEAQRALLDGAVAIRQRVGAAHIELRQRATLDVNWPCRQHKVSMQLALPSDFDLLWKGFSSKLRSQVRRAQKEAMQVQYGRQELLDRFYDVFSRNMRDLGTPVYSRRWFAAILSRFGEDACLAVVLLGDQPVAAGFLLGFKGTVEIVWASADRRYNRLSPNMLLYASVLEYACKRGYTTFDFGRSTPDTGTYRFKAQWGAKPVALHWYYELPPEQPLPDLSPSNKKFELAITLWRRLPLPLTRWAGPHIVKYIP